MTFVFTEKHVLTHYVSYSSKICVSTFSKTNVSDSGPWCYTRGSRAASILSGEPSVPGEIPGGVACGSIPGGLAASTPGGVPSVPRKIPGGMTSCPTPVSLISFVYTRSDRRFAYTRGGGVNPYSHQCPWGGERLGGRYTPVERLRRRLRD